MTVIGKLFDGWTEKDRRIAELEAENKALREAAQKAINSYKSSSGYEPSISVFHRDLDALQAALDKGE